jgi:hypothetical protein
LNELLNKLPKELSGELWEKLLRVASIPLAVPFRLLGQT